MRVLHLPALWNAALIALLWTGIHLGAAYLCLRLPDRFFRPDSPLFRTRGLERNGQIYDTLLRVSRWKELLPDGGGLSGRKGFRKKRLESLEPEYLDRFMMESARGELTHWLAILPFPVFGLFLPPLAVWLMLLYALLANLPCIIAQRYNRPRVARYMRLSRERAARAQAPSHPGAPS
ncbi:MAG TPA: glycosyl-4,4'-diaponeurosporenoate acyltransferase [Candidatus Limnocylindria bacterium]|nr:glycosyl-4,4'-diaponeurosporenoate acyltransferase [Candidatus Limnocylindria bacterium]